MLVSNKFKQKHKSIYFYYIFNNIYFNFRFLKQNMTGIKSLMVLMHLGISQTVLGP